MKPHKWTSEQKAFMTEFVPGHSHKEITDAFNNKFNEDLKPGQIKSFIGNHNLDTGRNGRFEKGATPFNKGKKGIIHPGSEKGWFKNGNLPHNHLEVGTEVINGDGYWQVKVAEPNVWKLKQRLVWEKANGPIPKGHVVVFADRDRANFDIDNLLLMSRQQFVRMNQNGLISANKEATKTGAIIADLIIKAASRAKEIKKHSSNL